MRRALWVSWGLAALLALSVGLASADLGDRVLSLGARGEDVVELQRSLTVLGYPAPVTGNYGSLTRRAVAAFQAQAGLPVTGRADEPTIEELKGWLAELEAFPTDDYEGQFLPPYGRGYSPYGVPPPPSSNRTGLPYGLPAEGWATPMGPGMMGGGMMGGMMGGGWGFGGGTGSGMMGGGWGGGRGFGGGWSPGMLGGGWGGGFGW